MRRRFTSTFLLIAFLFAVSVAPASAVSVSFANSYAVPMGSYGNGSVTYRYSSGISNYLRATASADTFGPGYQIMSIQQGRISSTSVRYTGPTGGSITMRVSGDFSRELSGGISLINGASFQHGIVFALRDVTTGTDVRSWTFANEEILCGGLVYPVGLGGCNGTTSDQYPSGATRSASGSGIVNGHYYLIRVYVSSVIAAGGVAFGLTAKTTARNLSGSISW